MTEPSRVQSNKNYSDPSDYCGKSELPSGGAAPPASRGPVRPPEPPPQQSAGTDALVGKFTAPLRLPAAKPTNNNAQRVSAMPAEALHADYGKTSSGDSVYASAALMKGAAGDGEAEVLSVSGQVGKQNEAAAILGRVQVKVTPRSSVSFEVLSSKVNTGVHNSDGSTGENIAAQTTILQVEAAHDFQDGELGVMRSGDSLAIGLSMGGGAEFHDGARDSDGDGRMEVCIRAGFGPYVLGACVEDR